MNTHFPITTDKPFRGITTIQLFDKNGKMIFEGDIVRVDCNWDGVVAYFEELTWDGGCSHPGYYCKEWIDYDNELSYHHNFYNCEVIGNIHDTPDLETEEESE